MTRNFIGTVFFLLLLNFDALATTWYFVNEVNYTQPDKCQVSSYCGALPGGPGPWPCDGTGYTCYYYPDDSTRESWTYGYCKTANPSGDCYGNQACSPNPPPVPCYEPGTATADEGVSPYYYKRVAYSKTTYTSGCKDNDGDGHYKIYAYCSQGDDCNDNDRAIYPGATEICDGKDNNCNGYVDEGLSTDADGDGHYTSGSCRTPNDDCNDNDPNVTSPSTWYKDTDGDGYPAADSNDQLITLTQCSRPTGYKLASELFDITKHDCDDATAEITWPCHNFPRCGPAESSNDTATGELTHNQELFSVKGSALPLNISLTYQSQNYVSGTLGPGWRHSYGIYLLDNGSSVIFRAGSEKRRYTLSSGVYTSPTGDYSTLVKNADGTYTITERSGTNYNFNASGKITSISNKYGNALTFAYSGDDLATVADSSGKTVTFGYDTTSMPHRLTSISDPVGNLYNFEYDTSGMLWKVVNPAPAPGSPQGYWEYTYYTGGYLNTKKDPSGNTAQYFYDDVHRLTKTIDPEGGTDPTGHTREYVYPTDSAAVGSTTFKEKDSGNWIYTYDTTIGYVKSKTDPNGNATSYTYYSDGSTKSVTRPGDGAARYTTFYVYDSYGNTITVSDPIDASTVDPETVTDPLTIPGIKVVSYAYDHANNDRILSISDERGTTPLTTSYQYTTESGYETTTITDPEGKTTKTRNNANGTVKDTTDANGKVTTYEYYPDTAENRTKGIVGLLYTVTDISGIKTTFTDYDKNGNSTAMKVTDSAGQDIASSTFSYDALGRLTGENRTALNNPALPVITTTYGYDLNRNRTSVIDPEGNPTTYEYNYRGQVKKVTDALTSYTTYSYGGAGGSGCSSCGGVDKLTSITDANLHTTSYQYDTLGRLQKEIDPLGKTLKYTYYDNGLVKQKIDATTSTENVLITYEYNSNGQLTKKRYADNTEETYAYDANIRLQTVTNSNISYTLTYYNNGWIKSVTDSNGKAITYDEYDGVGNRKQVTLLAGAADQRVITYDYDTANRPWHITSNAGAFTYNYDTSGRRHTLGYPNGITAMWSYDDLNRLTSLTHDNSVSTFAYTDYDKVGNRKAITANGSPTTYTYDSIYRLTQATKTKDSESYTYDAVGNRLTGPGYKDTGYTYNAANQMTAGRKINFSYDNNGNQTARTLPNGTDKSWTQYWDYENRLIKLEKVKGTERKTLTFKYDPFGRRIEKKFVTIKGGVTKTQTYSYIYDNEDIIQETLTTDTTTETTRYTHGPGIDEPLAMERNGQFYYYHADGLGSITAITDSTKTVKQSYTYDSFGMPKPTTSFRNAYTYTGREWDSEMGMFFLRARYLDPITGDFISRDPIGFRGGINLYSYTKNNPINRTDPTGLKWVWFCTARLGSGGSVRNTVASLYPAFGHCYVKLGNDARGFYTDGTGDGYWTSMQEEERTLLINRICLPAWVSECVYNCIDEGTKVGTLGASNGGSSLSNNCCTNLSTVVKGCKEKCCGK